MELDANKLMLDAVKDGLRDGLRNRFTSSYNNPLDALLNGALAEHGPALKKLIGDAIAACLGDEQFRANIAEQARHLLAKQLIQMFSGELEKAVNQLKSDPATRARIVLAIEQIVSQKA